MKVSNFPSPRASIPKISSPNQDTPDSPLPNLVAEVVSCETVPQFHFGHFEVIYASPQEDIILSNNTNNNTLLHNIFTECSGRFGSLVKLAKLCIFEIDDPSVLIVKLIEQSRLVGHFTAVKRQIRYFEDENKALLTVQSARSPPLPNDRIQILEHKLSECEERIKLLKGTIMNIENETFRESMKEWKLAAQVRLTKRTAKVEALAKEVEKTTTQLQTLEKRVTLMRQRRSQYARYFTENPNPSLRINGRIEDLLRRYGEQNGNL
jgi:hypothetical protein